MAQQAGTQHQPVLVGAQPRDLAVGPAPRQVGFSPALAPDHDALAPSPRMLSTQQLFNPPPEAEPGSTVSEEASSHPTVLSKLQKWGDYASVGEPVRPTNFVPMKTPMSREIISNWTLGDGPKHSLTVPELLAKQAAKGREVGLIIDLANHECLYAEDIPAAVEYAHVQLVAKVLPPAEAIDDVARIANEFWARHPDKHIAIHCAYGFNRTGFVVCAYLIQCCGLSVEEAMDSFAEARPPGVKHEKFINELYLRYGDRAGAAGGGGLRSSRSSSSGGRHSRQGSTGSGAQVDAPAAAAAGAGAAVMTRQRSKDSGGAVEAAGPSSEGVRSRSASRQASFGSLVAVSEDSRQGSESGRAGPSDGSCQVRQVRRVPSGRGGLSLAVEAEQREGGKEGGAAAGAAAGPAAATGEAQPPAEEATSLHDLRPARNLSVEADRLQSEIPMGRSTSLGLAKALCEDFSMHEGTPVRPSPLRGALAQESAFAYASSLASASPLDSPVSPPWAGEYHPPTQHHPGQQQKQQQPAGAAGGVAGTLPCCGSAAVAAGAARDPCGGGGSGGVRAPESPSAADAAAAAPSGLGSSGDAALCRQPASAGARLSAGCGRSSSHLHLPPLPHTTPGTCGSGRPISPTSSMDGQGMLLGSRSRVGNRFIRSMSVESDNQSLGFGARQALMHLRGEHEGSPDKDQPLSLLELFNADGSRDGADMAEGGTETASERSECEWEEKPSSTIPSRASSHQNLRGCTPPASTGSDTKPQQLLHQDPQQPPHGHHHQPQPRARPRPPAPPRNGKSKSNCRLM